MSRNPLNDPEYDDGDQIANPFTRDPHLRPGVDEGFFNGVGWGVICTLLLFALLVLCVWAGIALDHWLFP